MCRLKLAFHTDPYFHSGASPTINIIFDFLQNILKLHRISRKVPPKVVTRIQSSAPFCIFPLSHKMAPDPITTILRHAERIDDSVVHQLVTLQPALLLHKVNKFYFKDFEDCF